MNNQFYYRPWFWVLICIFWGGLFFGSLLPGPLQYADKLFGYNSDLFHAILAIGFGSSIILGFFFTRRGKGSTEKEALVKTGWSVLKMAIWQYLIVGIIILVLFIGLIINLFKKK